jgi:hypothetical protein
MSALVLHMSMPTYVFMVIYGYGIYYYGQIYYICINTVTESTGTDFKVIKG